MGLFSDLMNVIGRTIDEYAKTIKILGSKAEGNAPVDKRFGTTGIDHPYQTHAQHTFNNRYDLISHGVLT